MQTTIKQLGYLFAFILLASCSGEQEPTPQPEKETKPETETAEEKSTGTSAALIIDYGDTYHYINCIDLGIAGEMNGMEFLKASGLEMVENNGFTCKIGDTGCEILKCYNCECPDYNSADCKYWSYWHLVEGKWEFSQVGPEQYIIKPGAVECWKWGNQNTPPKMTGYSCD